MTWGVVAEHYRKGQTNGHLWDEEIPSPARGLYVGDGFTSGPDLSSDLERVTACVFLLLLFLVLSALVFFLLVYCVEANFTGIKWGRLQQKMRRV